LPDKGRHDILIARKVRAYKAAYPPYIGGANPPDYTGRRAMPMYVTYSDMIQIGIFIVALVGLCYTIFGGKK
jgi:hypothetical protein